MTTSVVILSYRPDDLRDLLVCLRVQTKQPVEIILIDTWRDGSLQGIAETILNGTGISLMYFHRPDLGTARGRNLGIETAHGALIVMLDDDMMVAPDYIESACEFFSKPEHQNAAGITMLGQYPGRESIPPDRSWQRRLDRTIKCIFLIDSRSPGILLPTGFRSELPGRTQRVQWLQGGNSVWRSSILKQYRFDEELERYPYALSEDVALSARVGKDYDLYVVSASGSFHKKSPGRRLKTREFGESLIRNHRHVSRIIDRRGSVPPVFHWASLGLLLHGLSILALRPTRDSLSYVQGLLSGIVATDQPSPVSMPDLNDDCEPRGSVGDVPVADGMPLPVTVVICVRNRATELAACLDSLRPANVTEIIVVDGCSTDGTVDVARARGAQIISDGGQGLGYARRLGVLAADQPFVMFVDSDVTIPDPATIRRMLDELISHGYTGLHAMVESDGCRTIWEHAQDAHFRLTFNKPGPRAAIGCVAALFKREVLLDCLPDPFMDSAEDGDMSHQIVERGGLLGVASVSVIHSHRSSFRSLWKQRIWYGRGNARRAWKDHSPRHLLGPILTAGYLMWQGFRTQNVCLLPYAGIHVLAGLMGEICELASLGHRYRRGLLSRLSISGS